MLKSLSENDYTYKTMTFTGQGQVTAVPNVAIIHVGVQTDGNNLVSAQSENARKVKAILNALQQLGVTDVKTYQYTIDKKYEYEDGKQIDRGYTVRNILEIKTNNMEQVGAIIDTSVNYGANIVDLISFDLSNRELYYKNALNLAVLDAIQKAKSVSMNLGITTDPVPFSIVENSVLPVPMQRYQREAAATPIVPGNIHIDASVTVDFMY